MSQCARGFFLWFWSSFYNKASPEDGPFLDSFHGFSTGAFSWAPPGDYPFCIGIYIMPWAFTRPRSSFYVLFFDLDADRVSALFLGTIWSLRLPLSCKLKFALASCIFAFCYGGRLCFCLDGCCMAGLCFFFPPIRISWDQPFSAGLWWFF